MNIYIYINSISTILSQQILGDNLLIVPLLTNSNSHTYLSNYIKQEFFLIFEMNIYILEKF